MNTSPIPAAAFAAMLMLFTGATWAAGDDHGHDHGAPTTSASTASPRFAAVSETFELVGVLEGRQLTLYLDRFADNSPVGDAQLDLSIDGAKVKAESHGEGVFEAMLAEPPKAGVLSIAATVVAGNASDLLAGELDLHEAAHADAAVAARPRWQRIAIGALGALFALGVIVWIARRRRNGGAA